MAKKKDMKTIAVFQEGNVLVGFEKVSEVKEGEVEVPDNCDLDTNSKYAWSVEDQTFVPLGTCLGKEDRPPVPQEVAIFLLMECVCNGTPPPQEIKDYVKWYKSNIKSRDDLVNSWRKK